MSAPQVPDRRSRRSRSALEAAPLELMAERDLTQISVSDLTKRADVNRSTFYEHYTDVHDLAAAACTDMFDELVAAAQTPFEGELSPVDALTRIFVHVGTHERLYRALLDADGSARVIDHLHQRLAIAIHVHRPGSTTSHADDPAEIPHDPVSALLAGALLGTVTDWLRHGCPGTPGRFAATIWPHLAGAGWPLDRTAARPTPAGR